MECIYAALILFIQGFIIGLLLSYMKHNVNKKEPELLTKINKILPQIQCAQCGYPGCMPYAKAILEQGEAINLCTPGSKEVIEELSELLDISMDSLEIPDYEDPGIAYIIEKDCIGCAICIKHCPVDAIVGSALQYHTIINDLCTGCELCIKPCPVNCIIMTPNKHQLHIEISENFKINDI